MSADRPYYRWRIEVPGHRPTILRFRSGVTRAELQTLYRGCVCEPVEGSAVEDRDDDNEGDDHAPA